MKSDDLVKELWSLANIIAGFSIAQSLAFAIALGKDLKELQNQELRVKIVIGAFCVAFGFIYSYGVWRCYEAAISVSDAYETIWREAMWGRIFAMFLMTGISLFGLFAPNIFKKESRAATSESDEELCPGCGKPLCGTAKKCDM
jgi:uncharacterized membrane protein